MEKQGQLSSKYHKCFSADGMDEPSLARWHFVKCLMVFILLVGCVGEC